MPSAAQELDGQVIMTLGAKGVIEVELVSSGERWGRGPQRDIHSSNKARVDSPAWHLVEALATLVSPDGNDPAIDGFAAKARPLSPAEKAMRSEEHTSELQSRLHLVCRLLLEKKKRQANTTQPEDS